MQLIHYRDQIAAVAGADRVHLAPYLEQLPNEHPDKLFVLALALYAHQVERRELAGEPPRYLPRRAHRHVREQIMPRAAFLELAGRLTDVQLAMLFHAPLEQVGERRRELDAPELVRTRPWRTLAASRAYASSCGPARGRSRRWSGQFRRPGDDRPEGDRSAE